MSHKPNLLSWDQDVAASPREFHETDNNRTNSAALLATWQYFSFRHIWFSKLLSHQKLSQIILSYFSNALSFEQGKRSFQISGKLSSFAKITDKKIARHFEKHRCVTWRHTGSDESTNVYPRDAPSLLAKHIRSHFSYIAPELRNGTAKPSVSSDIYSLAFVLKSFYKILDFKLNGTVKNAPKELSDNRPSLCELSAP